jgi:hypothetical protein
MEEDKEAPLVSGKQSVKVFGLTEEESMVHFEEDDVETEINSEFGTTENTTDTENEDENEGTIIKAF